MPPVQIDVFFPVPEGWGFCTTCEMLISQADVGDAPGERGLSEYPPEWQEDFKRLSSLIFTIAERYPDTVHIRIWDPRSLQGLIKSIRHGVRKYPTFILNGKSKLAGWDGEKLDQSIQTAVKISQLGI